jgi:hypothetical protein
VFDELVGNLHQRDPNHRLHARSRQASSSPSIPVVVPAEDDTRLLKCRVLLSGPAGARTCTAKGFARSECQWCPVMSGPDRRNRHAKLATDEDELVAAKGREALEAIGERSETECDPLSPFGM